MKAKVKSNWKHHRPMPWYPSTFLTHILSVSQTLQASPIVQNCLDTRGIWQNDVTLFPPIESTLALKRGTFSRLIIMQWISKTNTRSRFSQHAFFWNWLKSPLGLIVQTNLIKCVLYQPNILHLCSSSMSGPIETSPNASPPCFPPQLSNCSLNGAAEPAG